MENPNSSSSSSSSASRMDSSEADKVFNRFDENGDGKISPSELSKLVHAIDTTVTDAEVSVMIDEMDADHDGFVDKEEFKDFQSSGDDAESVLKDAFDAYDLDRNGLISATELQMVLKKLGDKCRVEDCERMIRSVDEDKDGSVDFGEFKRMMSGQKSK